MRRLIDSDSDDNLLSNRQISDINPTMIREIENLIRPGGCI